MCATTTLSSSASSHAQVHRGSKSYGLCVCLIESPPAHNHQVMQAGAYTPEESLLSDLACRAMCGPEWSAHESG